MYVCICLGNFGLFLWKSRGEHMVCVTRTWYAHGLCYTHMVRTWSRGMHMVCVTRTWYARGRVVRTWSVLHAHIHTCILHITCIHTYRRMHLHMHTHGHIWTPILLYTFTKLTYIHTQRYIHTHIDTYGQKPTRILP